MLITLLQLIGGIVCLILGADLLVRGASRLAALVGLSPLIIGLTIVAYGTSAPELAVSLQAGLADRANIALGNVVGSNIFNVLFILGLSALITPLRVSWDLIRFHVPLMIAVSVLLLLLGIDHRLGRMDGILLFGLAVLVTVFTIRKGQTVSGSDTDPTEPETSTRWNQWYIQIALILTGFALLVLGARWLVNSAVVIARELGLTELIIGLTIVAAGTSLPEVATSIVASIRGERDIAVGNVVGSNIFNILAVCGLSSLVSPNGIAISQVVLSVDIPVMIAVAVACLPIFFTGNVIARWEGLLFCVYYAIYVFFLFLSVTGHPALHVFSTVLLVFVIPLTLVTLLILAIRGIGTRHLTGAD